MEEFRVVISYFLDFESSTRPNQNKNIVSDDRDQECSRSPSSNVDTSAKIGTALTAAGPPKYTGDILNDPDMLWAEDDWNEEREEEAQQRIQQQGAVVPQFWRKKYENDSPQFWHEFYKRNEDNFYKDRHYLHIVFPDLATPHSELPSHLHSSDGRVYLLEVGSGVGNAVLPLLEINSDLYIYAFDIATSAINILTNHPLYRSSGRMSAAVHNIASDEDTEADLSRVINGDRRFVSNSSVMAIAPQRHVAVFQRLSSVLVSGGKLFLRDYGRYDEAQLRFKKGSKIAENFYVRQDGTCSYFFTTDELCALATNAGMEVQECYYIRRQYANRGKKEARYRTMLW